MSKPFPSRIVIEMIPHSRQRYETVGDWRYAGRTLLISVSKMADWRYVILVAIHELVEVVLCHYAGVTQKQVDKFDMDYEKQRVEGDVSEPGDAYGAPYLFQHCIATGVERVLAAVLGVTWQDYEEEINQL